MQNCTRLYLDAEHLVSLLIRYTLQKLTDKLEWQSKNKGNIWQCFPSSHYCMWLQGPFKPTVAYLKAKFGSLHQSPGI